MTGEDVLHALVRETDRDVEPGFFAAATSTHLAHTLRSTSRLVGARLRVLEEMGLARRGNHARLLKSGRVKVLSGITWRPTSRGIEVDEALDRISPDRGGVFEPRSAHLNHGEILALR